MTTKIVKEGGLIIVEIKIKGIEKIYQGNFVLDTGATYTTISKELLLSIGYKNNDFGEKINLGTAGGRSSARWIKVKSFSSLGLIRSNFNIISADFPSNLMIDGLLGLDFIKNHILKIDLKKNTISFN